MIGGKSGQWYYYNGNKWIRQDPEFPDEEAVESGESGGYSIDPDRPDAEDRSEEDISVTVSPSSDDEGDKEVDNATVLLPQEEEKEDQNYRFKDDGEVRQRIDLEDSRETVTMDPNLTTRQPPVSRTCKNCSAQIPQGVEFCPECGANREGEKPATPKEEDLSVQYYKNEIEIKRIRLSSLIFLFGGFGIIVGVVFGAVFGVLDVFGGLLDHFPSMLQEARGKLQGGLIFGALGGISFSIVHMALAAILGTLYNLLSMILGGVKFKF
jgi:hypothetical protein